MASEFDALQRQQTWSLVPPSNQNVIGCRWVYKIKRNTDGSVSRYKARLVAKGFHQQAEVDFDEMFSPVVKPPTVRIILSLATQNQRSLRQLDVNDIIITGNNLTAISNIISQLSIAFELKDLDLLHKLNMIDCKAASTPIATTHILTTTTTDLLSDPTPYQSLVRALQYATLTRPDITFVVNHAFYFNLALLLSLPLQMLIGLGTLVICVLLLHFVLFLGNNLITWLAKKQHVVSRSFILKQEYRSLASGAAELSWIRQHQIQYSMDLDKGILFQPGLIALTAFTNADWAGDPCDLRSTSGIDCISWQQSSSPGLLRNTHCGAAKLSWIRQVLCDLGLFLPSAPLIWCDNTNALALASNPIFHGRTKHIEVDYHFICERVVRGYLALQFISTDD
uniref:Reverse transcriptase Ty1/copia-type domain-containing protein n=1 Tax=Fagus sylvatica TaxID=28930 RepID=A0A2N9EQH5_FAGSY